MAAIIPLKVLWHLSPRIILIYAPYTQVSLQDLSDSIKNVEDEPVNLSYPYLIKTSGKEDLGSGVYVGLTAELQNAQIAFQQRTKSDSSGTVTTANSQGSILKDSAATFITDGIQTGDTILNINDKSVTTIISVDSETQITHFVLEDGTNNDWEVGDEYKIWNKIQCEVGGGNLVAVDNNRNTISAFVPSFATHVIRTSSSSATLQELSAIQYSSFNGGVTIDVINGVSGTEFPIGTIEAPINNLTDALTIAEERGFKKLYILESMTFGGTNNFSDFIIRGASHVNTVVTIADSAESSNVTFENCHVIGVLDGGSHLANCMIGDITYVNGHLRNCGIYGTITLAGNEDAILMDCGLVDPDSPPIIDMGGSGQDCIVQDWSGAITFKNLTTANKITVQIDGGKITLDSTITDGIIDINGIGLLIDNATSYTTLTTSGLLNRENIANNVWDEDLNEHTTVNSAGEQVQKLRKLESNKAVISEDGLTVTIYDDDDITPLHVYTISADKRIRTPV